jgi:hypothetical protein
MVPKTFRIRIRIWIASIVFLLTSVFAVAQSSGTGSTSGGSAGAG